MILALFFRYVDICSFSGSKALISFSKVPKTQGRLGRKRKSRNEKKRMRRNDNHGA